MIHTPEQMTVEQRPNMRGGAGNVTVRQFFKPDEFGAKVRLCANLTLPPGASIGLHKHEGEDEVYIITRGSGVLDDTLERTRVNAGDVVLTGKGESHAISNDGNTDLEVIAVIMLYP